MYNTETLQTLFNHFNEDCEDRGETKETLGRLIENLLTFYLVRNPPEKEVKECQKKQLSLIGEDKRVSPMLIADFWERSSDVCFKYNFVKATAISNFKKRMKRDYTNSYSKCFRYSKEHGSMVPQININAIFKFILRHKGFANGYHERIKFLISEKQICL